MTIIAAVHEVNFDVKTSTECERCKRASHGLILSNPLEDYLVTLRRFGLSNHMFWNDLGKCLIFRTSPLFLSLDRDHFECKSIVFAASVPALILFSIFVFVLQQKICLLFLNEGQMLGRTDDRTDGRTDGTYHEQYEFVLQTQQCRQRNAYM